MADSDTRSMFMNNIGKSIYNKGRKYPYCGNGIYQISGQFIDGRIRFTVISGCLDFTGNEYAMVTVTKYSSQVNSRAFCGFINGIILLTGNV